MRTTVVVMLAALLATSQAGAEQVAANPGRPTFSDNAHVTATGYLEIELGGAFYRAGGVDNAATPWLLKLGVAGPFEFKVGGDGFVYTEADNDHFGYGNMQLWGKLRFFEQAGMRPAMTAMLGVNLPTASDEIFGRTTDLYLLLLMSGRFGPMGWDINVGLDARALDKDDQYLDLPAILALSATIYGPLGVALEVSDYIPLSDQDNQLNLLGALTWALNSRLVLDAAFVKGFSGAPSWQVLFGFTSTLARLW